MKKAAAIRLRPTHDAPAPSEAPREAAREAMYRNILVPTDGSKLSEAAADEAVRLADALGARVTAIHVAPDVPPIELESWARSDDRFLEHIERSFEKNGRAFLRKVAQLAAEYGVPCEEIFVRAASPAAEIAVAAKDNGCDLIVMGSRGKGGDDPLLGSVTAQVLATCRVPVLVHRR